MNKTPVVVVLTTVLALAGCSNSSSGGAASEEGQAGAASNAAGATPAPGASGGSPGPAASGAAGGPALGSGQPTATPTPTPPPIVIPAKVGDCFRYKSIDHWTLDEASAVPCKRKHTAQTVYVGSITDLDAISFEAAGQLDAKARKAGGAEKLAPAEKAQWDAYVRSVGTVSQACDKAIVKATKAKTPKGVVTSSLFTSDLTGPTQAEWDKGARWVRCNAVAHLVADDFNASPALLSIPADLKTSLSKGTKFRNCWIPLNDNKAARSVQCTSRAAKGGAWLTLSDQLRTPKTPWPGQRGAIAAAKSPCLSLVGHFSTARTSTAKWWVWHVDKNGVPKSGGTKATWGTPNSHFGCAMPNWQFKPYH